MNSNHRRLMALVSMSCAVALAAPVAGASAAVLPTLPAGPLPALPAGPLPALPAGPLPVPSAGPLPVLPGGGIGVSAIGGNQIGEAGCVGTNRPSFGGNSGSTSAQTCGAVLSFQGPQIGQVASAIGPTIIGSVIQMPINTTNGAITTTGY
jgi:hypothetical protein